MPRRPSRREAFGEVQQQNSDKTATPSNYAAIGSDVHGRRPNEEPRAGRRSSESSFGEARSEPKPQTTEAKFHVLQRLKNKALEDIAPNPVRDIKI